MAKKLDDKTIIKIIDYRQRGYTARKISKLVNLSEATVTKYIRKYSWVIYNDI